MAEEEAAQEFERQIELLMAKFHEYAADRKELAYLGAQLLGQRDQLLEMLERVLEEYAPSVGRTALVIRAEDLLRDIYNELEMSPKQAQKQVDTWIDTVGTAPPGVDLDHIAEIEKLLNDPNR